MITLMCMYHIYIHRYLLVRLEGLAQQDLVDHRDLQGQVVLLDLRALQAQRVLVDPVVQREQQEQAVALGPQDHQGLQV